MKPKYLWFWLPAVALMLWDIHAGLFTTPAPAHASAVVATSQYPMGSLPDPKLTPGATLPVTADQVCAPGYSKKARNVSEAEKTAVWNEYLKAHPEWHLPPKHVGTYEEDHLISLELGGSNDIRNIWPQPYSGPWNAHMKDALENLLHKLVCEHRETLQQAQHEICTDWVAAYKSHGLGR